MWFSDLAFLFCLSVSDGISRGRTQMGFSDALLSQVCAGIGPLSKISSSGLKNVLI